MKVQTSIDPKLIAMLGRKLYSNHPVPIIVRELLQNSIDACRRAGVEPRISITINQSNNREVTIICDDNGCGMSPDEIVNDFLCLGGTNKRGTSSVGGFGIAKAAIMSGIYWKVETLSWEFDFNDMMEGNDIRELNTQREGTRVTVQLDELTYSWHLEDAIRWIYTSEIDICLKIDSSNGIHFEDFHAGLHEELMEMQKGIGWIGLGIGKIDTYSGRIVGRNFVRLNGLTQFQISCYGDARESNLIIDVYTDEDPESKNYPLTVSREKLTDTIQTEIMTWLRTFEGEGSSTDLHVKRLILPDRTRIVPGYVLVGERTKFPTNGIESDGIANQDFERIQKFIGSVIAEREKATEQLQEYIKEGAESSILMITNYEVKESSIIRDSNLLCIWNTLLKTIVPEGNVFGTGFIGDKEIVSSIDTSTSLPFFQINPENILADSRDPKSAVVSLWTSCCHEVAHLTEYRHSTEFCSTWQSLMTLTSKDIIDKIDILSSILMGTLED